VGFKNGGPNAVDKCPEGGKLADTKWGKEKITSGHWNVFLPEGNNWDKIKGR